VRRSTNKRNAVEKFSRRPVRDVEKVKSFSTNFDGGVNEIDTLLGFPPNDALYALNYVPEEGGGFSLRAQLERFDGTPSPTDADYYATPYELFQDPAIFYAGHYLSGATSGMTGLFKPLNAIHFKNGTEKFVTGTQFTIRVEVYNPVGPTITNEELLLNCRGVSLQSGSWEGGDAAGVLYTEDYVPNTTTTAIRALDGSRITGYDNANGEAELVYSGGSAARFIPPRILSNGATSAEISSNTPPSSNVYKIPFNNGSSNEHPSDSDLSFPEWFRTPCMIKSDQGHYFWLTEVEVTSGDPTTDDAAGFLCGVPMVGDGTALSSATYFYSGGDVEVGGSLCGGYAEINGALAASGDYASLEDSSNTGAWKAKGVLPLLFWNGTAFTEGEDLNNSTPAKVGEVLAGEDETGVGGYYNTGLDYGLTNWAVYWQRFYIQPVPGQGPIRGIFEFAGEIYAAREVYAGGTLGFWKASGSTWSGTGATPSPTDNWTPVSTYNELEFDAGSEEISPGDVVVGAASGATMTVLYVSTRSGTVGGGDQAGILVFDGYSVGSTFTNNETLNVDGSPVAVANGTGDLGTFAASSPATPFDVIKANFGNGEQVYMTTGGSDIAIFDGSKIYRSKVGSSAELGGYPEHIIEHKKYLFCSIGSSVYQSGVGNPLAWTAIEGAAEFSMENNVNGFSRTPGGLMAIVQQDQIDVLYGTQPSEWDLKTQPSRIGAIKYSLQPDSNPIFTDVQGITTLSAVQEFGDFRATEMSKMINTTLKTQINNIVTAVKIKDLEQYWLFFSDGTGIAGYFGGDTPRFGFFSFQSPYYKTPSLDTSEVVLDSAYEDKIRPFEAFATDYVNGQERVFIGDRQGFLFELNVGTSLDGAPLEAYLRLAPWNMKSPNINKSFIKATVYVEASEGSEVLATYELDYGDWSLARGESTNNAISNLNDIDSTGGYWGIDEWGTFTWGGRAVSELNIHIDAPARNLGLILYSLSAEEPQHKIEGCVVDYIIRGRKS
jgi:hypothetical protein